MDTCIYTRILIGITVFVNVDTCTITLYFKLKINKRTSLKY